MMRKRHSCLLILIALLAQRAWSAEKPMPVKADVAYGPHEHQRLDLYVPPKGAEPFLVVGAMAGG